MHGLVVNGVFYTNYYAKMQGYQIVQNTQLDFSRPKYTFCHWCKIQGMKLWLVQSPTSALPSLKYILLD